MQRLANRRLQPLGHLTVVCKCNRKRDLPTRHFSRIKATDFRVSAIADFLGNPATNRGRRGDSFRDSACESRHYAGCSLEQALLSPARPVWLCLRTRPIDNGRRPASDGASSASGRGLSIRPRRFHSRGGAATDRCPVQRATAHRCAWTPTAASALVSSSRNACFREWVRRRPATQPDVAFSTSSGAHATHAATSVAAWA